MWRIEDVESKNRPYSVSWKRQRSIFYPPHTNATYKLVLFFPYTSHSICFINYFHVIPMLAYVLFVSLTIVEIALSQNRYEEKRGFTAFELFLFNWNFSKSMKLDHEAPVDHFFRRWNGKSTERTWGWVMKRENDEEIWDEASKMMR